MQVIGPPPRRLPPRGLAPSPAGTFAGMPIGGGPAPAPRPIPGRNWFGAGPANRPFPARSDLAALMGMAKRPLNWMGGVEAQHNQVNEIRKAMLAAGYPRQNTSQLAYQAYMNQQRRMPRT